MRFVPGGRLGMGSDKHYSGETPVHHITDCRLYRPAAPGAAGRYVHEPFSGTASAQTPANMPNIVMIMADDVGIPNISAYHRGMMGGSTPNIDRIAREGALFTDYDDARQSCTAGRAAFITGRQDPWERYQDESMMYARWWGDKLWTMVPGVNIVGRFLLRFK